MNNINFVNELAGLRPSSTFLMLKNYCSETSGEVADHIICFHISYETALKRSIETLRAYECLNELEVQAKDELIKSYEASLEKIATTEIEEISDGYSRYFDEEGKYVKGCKLHVDTNTLHVYGLAHQKRVHKAGTYKEVKSRPLTVIKNKLRKMCVVDRFRQYRITADNVEMVKVEKLELLPPE